MRKNMFIATFIVAHVIFIFLQIHKHAQFIKQSYRKQKNEKLHDKLRKEKDILTHQLHSLQRHGTIKSYAQNKLNMVPMHIRQIKRVPCVNQ